jgi:nicotinamidase/pyrazinamidase
MKTVFVDVDTQIDFLYPAGALYAPGSERIVRRIGALNHWAASQGIPVLSTMCAHVENDPEFRDWPPHCVVGTIGQQKPPVTLVDDRVEVPGNADISTARQICFQKKQTDMFLQPELAPLLDQLGAERYVVYGVVTEVCVQFAVDGLLKRGAKVEVVSDAVQPLNEANGQQVLQSLAARGAVLRKASEVMAAA